MAEVDLTVPDVPEETYPPFAVGESDRERWRVCHALAEAISRTNEESGRPNPTFVWYFSRSLFHSDMPTGSPDDPVPDLAEAEAIAVAVEAAVEEAEVGRVLEMLERARPADDASEEAHWKHVGRICDVLDGLLGTPDELDELIRSHVGRVDTGSSERLVEAFEHVVAGPYRKDLHPRDRAGRWARTLHALRAFARDHADEVKQHLGRQAGGNDADAAKLRARAKAARAIGKVARGAKQAAVETHHRSKIAAVSGLAMVYSERAEQKLGVFHENFKDPLVSLETVERAKTTHELMSKAAEWAVEHHEELATVVKVARAAGHLVAADEQPLADADLEEAETLLEDLLA